MTGLSKHPHIDKLEESGITEELHCNKDAA